MKLLHKIGPYLFGAYLVLFGFDIISIPIIIYILYRFLKPISDTKDESDPTAGNPFIL